MGKRRRAQSSSDDDPSDQGSDWDSGDDECSDEVAEDRSEKPGRRRRKRAKHGDEDDASEDEPSAQGEDAPAEAGSAQPQYNSDEEAEKLLDELTERLDTSLERLALLNHFDQDQLDRYEHFRRSKFRVSFVKKIMSPITNSSINKVMAIVVSGVTKTFVGELVELALDIQKEWGEAGRGRRRAPLKPAHLREAYRRLKVSGNAFPGALSQQRMRGRL